MTTSFGNARGVISLDFFYKGATTIGKYAELLIIYNQLVINFFEKRRGIFFEKTKIRKKVQGVLQLQVALLPRHREETKQAKIEQTHEIH